MSVGIDQRISKHCLRLRNSIRMLKLLLVTQKSVRIILVLFQIYITMSRYKKILFILLGIEIKFKHLIYPILIQPTQIKEMREIIETPDALRIGASVTLVELEETLRHYIKIKPGNYRSKILYIL